MASGAAARVTPRVLAVLLVGVLASERILLRMAVTSPPWSGAGFTSLLFVTLTVISVVGLLLLREWGFYSAYLLVPFSTLFHGLTLVPFVTNALATLPLRVGSVAILNLLFLVAVAGTHWAVRTGRAGPSVGGRQPA